MRAHCSTARYKSLVIENEQTNRKVERVKARNISSSLNHHYRHFNAAVLKRLPMLHRASRPVGGENDDHAAGAMSTAELGVSLAEMIRQDKSIHCLHRPNLEEDLFNLVARSKYERIPNIGS